MSIPGLGQIIPQATAASTTTARRTITLRPGQEWRFTAPRRSTSGVTVRLLNGTAERDGTALAVNRTYTFIRTKSKLFSWHGCILEVEGDCEDYVAEFNKPEDNVHMVMCSNLHDALQTQRQLVSRGTSQQQGPRVLVCGAANTGKTTLVRTLAALATRMGAQPVIANLDPGEGLLSMPGTMSSAVFGNLMDVEDPAGGFGVRSSPSTGPSAVPVKTPLVYYFGHKRVEDDAELWKELAAKMAGQVRNKLRSVDEARSAGLVVDTPAVDLRGVDGGVTGAVDMLAHAVREFTINVVVVLDSLELEAKLQRRFAGEKTLLGETITVCGVEKSDGVAERDEAWIKADGEAVIKEYFFGDAKRTLSPFTLSIDYDELAVFKAVDADSEYYDPEEEKQPALERAEISPEMSNWTLAVMDAHANQPLDTIRQAPVMGFIAVADVDEDKRRLKYLSPVGGRLGDKALIWGRWPEPYLNLLG